MSTVLKYIFVIMAISFTISSSKKAKVVFEGLGEHLINWEKELGEMSKILPTETNVKGNLQAELKKNVEAVKLQKNIIRTLCNALKESYNEFVQDVERINNDEKLSPENVKLIEIPGLLAKFSDFQTKVDELVGIIEEANEKESDHE